MFTPLRKLAVGVAALVALSSLAACTTPAADQDLSISIGVDATTFDRIGNTGGSLKYFGNNALYESLIGWDAENSEYIPWLAKEWQLADDRLSIDFVLNENVDFQDGTHLDAQAIADAIPYQFDPALGLATAEDPYGVTIEVTGEYAFTLHTTKEITTIFLQTIRDLPILSPTYLKETDELHTHNETAGTGPYVVEDSVPDASYSFIRNPDYWNPDAFPYDEVEILLFDDKIAAANALRSGQIDATSIDVGLAADLEADGFTIVQGGGDYITLLTLDYTGEILPALADVRVRQAINMAIDGQSMLDSIEQGYGTVDDEPFGVSTPEYVEGLSDVYPYDVDAAKELLADAGYADGFDVTIAGASNSGVYPVAYEPVVQQALAEIGIRVTFETFPDEGAMIEAWRSGAYPLLLVRPSYENTLDILVGDPAFLGHAGDDETWAGLMETIETGSVEESAEASQEIGQYMIDQAWYAPLVHTARLWAVSPEVDLALGRDTININLWRFRPAD